MKKEEEVLNRFVHKWLLIGAKAILTVLFGGLLTFFATLNSTVNNLKAEAMVDAEKVSKNSSEIKDLKGMIRDIHWLLIKSKNIKIPAKK